MSEQLLSLKIQSRLFSLSVFSLGQGRYATLSVIFLLFIFFSGASLQAQEETVESSEVEIPEIEALPSILRAEVATPFSGATVLQARKLRGLSGQAASLVMLGNVGGSIAIESSAFALPAKDGKAKVPFFVEIDGSTFLQTNQADIARVEIYAYALDENRKVADYFAEAFAVDVQNLGEAVWQTGLKFYGSLSLPPGLFTIRTLVRNYQSEANALREVKVDVKDEKTGYALPLLFSGPETRDTWMPIRPWQAEILDPYPFVSGEKAISPATRPVIVAGRNADASLFASAFPAGKIRGKISFSRDGKVVERADVESQTSASQGASELVHAPIRFTVPDLQPGTYALDARLKDHQGNEWNVPATEVFVLQQGTQEREMLWTDLRGRSLTTRIAESKTERPDPKDASATRKKKRAREIAAQYQAALLEASTQSPAASSLSALLNFESAFLTDASRGGLDLLLAGQMQLAKKLANKDVEALVPIMKSHEELYLTYRKRRLFSLASHTRVLIEQIADLYARKGSSEGSRIVAARALTSLAGHLQAVNLPSSSRRLFRRSLELDPRNQAALISLAISYERFGDRTQAIEFLETLVGFYPKYGEALVRLAINVQRFGQRTRSRQLFEQALETNGPSWVHALAYQELARSYLTTGDLEKMVDLLEEAIERIPDQASSLVLLAHAYDRQLLPRRAIDLVQSLSNARQVSARKIYDGWSEPILERARQAFTDAAQVRLPSLQASIQGDVKL